MWRLAHHVRLISKLSVAPRFVSTASHEVRQIFRTSDAVCFDVDSTVVREEGIDCLAEALGKGLAVSDLTKRAMEGGMNFREALTARLEIIKPTQTQVDQFVKEHPFTLSPKVTELVKCLQGNGKKVFLVSGGFRQLIEPVAARVGVPTSNIFANTFLFPKDSTSPLFDMNELTSDSGGKGKVVSMLMQKHGFRSVVMVGDGATDMEARPPASIFICYGGVVTRPGVQAKADWFVTDFQELIDEFKTCGTEKQQAH